MDDRRYPADWNGTSGSTTYNSNITCVACHNVHGSTRLAMVRNGELVNREPGLLIWYRNDSTYIPLPPNGDPPVPDDIPLSASDGTVWRGGSSSNLCSHCHFNNNLVEEFRYPFQDLTQDPTLAWTGEANFVTDGANPDSAITGSSFQFRVKYSDENNDAPGSIQVWVDKNSDGDYDDGGEKIGLTEVDGGDDIYYDGKIYSTSIVLNNTGGNSKKYRFYAVGGGANATGAPTCDSSVYVFDSSAGSGIAPVVNWTGRPTIR
jgi:hypothetical protein